METYVNIWFTGEYWEIEYRDASNEDLLYFETANSFDEMIGNLTNNKNKLCVEEE